MGSLNSRSPIRDHQAMPIEQRSRPKEFERRGRDELSEQAASGRRTPSPRKGAAKHVEGKVQNAAANKECRQITQGQPPRPRSLRNG